MQRDGLERAAMLLSRTLLIMGFVAAAVVTWIAVGAPALLSREDRVVLATIALLPPVGFLISLWLLLGRKRFLSMSGPFWLRSFAAGVVLFLPAAYVLFRHSRPWLTAWHGWGFAAGFGALLVLPMPFLGEASGVEEIGRALFLHVYKVMWWRTDESLSEGAQRLIASQRQSWYVEKTSLLEFQATWRGQLREAQAVVASLASARPIEAVLDVGGGDGAVTSAILEGLGTGERLRSTRVFMVDPVDWVETYSRVLGRLGVAVNAVVGRFGEGDRVWPAQQYDLVLAMHSLYGICDRQKASIPARDAVCRLLGLAKPSGTLVIGLASRRSVAYDFKAKALRLLTGGDVSDLVAEDLALTPELNAATLSSVDHVFDLSTQFEAYDSDREGPMVRWLQYFLRAPVREGDPWTADLVEMLRSYARPVSSLPEGLLRPGEMGARGPDSPALLHKTTVWSLERSKVDLSPA